MERFDVFKSEGGWRVACNIWQGNPDINNSPWFATEKAAIAFSAKKQRELKAENEAMLREAYPGYTSEEVEEMWEAESMGMSVNQYRAEFQAC